MDDDEYSCHELTTIMSKEGNQYCIDCGKLTKFN